MTKPTIVTVDDDPGVLASISRDLRSRYGHDYRVIRASSGAQALDVLAELALRARPVALIATDQWMPGMTGIQMLTRARQHAPDAKLLLLTAYADTEAAVQAINDVGLDYYLLKPWDPPAERLYPVVDDLLGDWRQAHPPDAGELRVVGHRWSQRSHEVKTFLTRNHVPYQWLEIDRDEEARTLSGSHTPTSTTSRSCWCRTASPCAPHPTSTSRAANQQLRELLDLMYEDTPDGRPADDQVAAATELLGLR